MIKVLTVDDDTDICLFLNDLLKRMGHQAYEANTLNQAKSLCEMHSFDLVLLDLELPDGNGIDILPELVKTPSQPEIIIITGTGDAIGAEIAFKYGAWDYIQKPFLLNEVSLPITRALEYRKEKQADKLPIILNRSEIIGKSEAIDKCLAEVVKASITDSSVLVTGETGTGKELISRAIHNNSIRSQKPFIVVDCGALPDNLVESTLFGHDKGAFTGADKKRKGLILQADGGTLMLDEIGELPLPVQKIFLRTLQERTIRPIGAEYEIPVDFRLIAATNLDLEKQVKKKEFREDLLYRIRAIEIVVPSLRERKEDIEEITLKKLHEITSRYNLEPKACSRELILNLKANDWPGNVRELISVLEYCAASSGKYPTLFPKHLPPKYRTAKLEFEPKPEIDLEYSSEKTIETNGIFPTMSDYRKRMEKHYLKKLLGKAGDNREEACRISGLSKSSFYNMLKKHGLRNFGNTS